MIPSKFIDGEVYGLMWFNMKDPRKQRVPTAEEIEELAILLRMGKGSVPEERET